MKNTTTRLIMVGIFGACAAAWGQGSLTPPGAPAPTMKTLDQVEPRTAISSLPVTISQSGSYYLTSNLTGVAGTQGITISASDVTIDLNGFALIGVPGSREGIWVNGKRFNITIRNGVVRDWGRYGVDASNAYNSMLINVKAFTNGWDGPVMDGLKIGSSSIVKDCETWANQSDGIVAGVGCTISKCTAYKNGDDGIVVGLACTISECAAEYNSGDGITIGAGSTASGCAVAHNTSNGIVAGHGCTISECTACNNGADGITVTNFSSVLGNTCYNNGYSGDGAGIHVLSSGNRIEGNNVTQNDRGIDVDAGGNLIIRNSARENTTEYDIASGNAVGPITSTPVGAGPWDNFDL